MKINRILSSFKIILTLLLAGTSVVAANLPASIMQASATPAALIDLGESGTAFAFEENIGATDVPYLVDNEHLNRPWNMYIDPADNDLFVIEQEGARLLKYDAAKKFVWSVGKAGVKYTENDGFGNPQDVAQAPDGHIWVADGSRIVEYNASGEFVRNVPEEEPWRSSQEDGRFDLAAGITFDGLGHLYVGDQNAHRVSIFDWTAESAPVYKTSIGVTGVFGSALPYLNQPTLVKAKADGTLYILELGNQRVLTCPYTVGKDSWACAELAAGYEEVHAMTLSPAGDLFVMDNGATKIYKCAGGAAPCAQFRSDTYGDALAVDSDGTVYLSNRYSCIIARYNKDGSFRDNYLGVIDTCYLTDNAHFFQPRVEVDAQGNMLVLEEAGNRLLKFDPNGTLLWSFGQAGHDSWDDNHLNWPHGLTTDPQGNIYVADSWRVKIFNPDGVLQHTIGKDPGQPNPTFSWVTDVAVDPHNGNIYVVDNHRDHVLVFNSAHAQIGQLGVTNDSGECGENADNQHFCGPVGVEVDADGSVYVTDWGNQRVQKFNSQRQYQMTFGLQGQGGDQHGEISGPDDVEVDGKGRVYVADMSGRVEVFDPTGAYLTTIGGSGDSDFRVLSDVSVSSSGTVYVSDLSRARIRTYTLGVPGWEQANLNGFGNRNAPTVSLEVFKDQIYAGAGNWNEGARIYRSPDGKTWTEVTTTGEGIYKDNNSIMDMDVFGDHLYAATGWSSGRAPQIWRTADGLDWSPVVTDGFGDVHNTTIDALLEFNGYLYASVDGEGTNVGASIYRSATGNAGSWQPVVTGGNGDTKNEIVDDFITFNGVLYGFGKNNGHGAFVWRASADGSAWTQVNTYGFGADQLEAIAAEVFNGVLYVGTYNESDQENPSPGQLWKTTDGATWTAVMSDGFGDDKNHSVTSLVAARGKLYAITKNSMGSEVWATDDGQNWSQINPNGFGSPTSTWTLRNHSDAYFNDSLYLGIINESNGAQIWAKTLVWKSFMPFCRR